MKKEKIAKLKMTKHSRMKRQRIRGGAREARARDALGRKIIIRYICRDKKRNKNYFNTQHLYIQNYFA